MKEKIKKRLIRSSEYSSYWKDIKSNDDLLCEIKIKGANRTGFFFKIPFKEKELMNCLMINHHVLNEKHIQENKVINLLLNDDKEALVIDISI